jgi:hypothetical protein
MRGCILQDVRKFGATGRLLTHLLQNVPNIFMRDIVSRRAFKEINEYQGQQFYIFADELKKVHGLSPRANYTD